MGPIVRYKFEMNHIPNLKYKTTMCQNWQANEPCPKGPGCYFAHGPLELRTVEQNQQIIGQRNQLFLSYNQQYNMPTNYKTIKCKFYNKGQCQLGDSCTFYHCAKEKRQNLGSDSPELISPYVYSYPLSNWYGQGQPKLETYFSSNLEHQKVEQQIAEDKPANEADLESEREKLTKSHNTDLSDPNDFAKQV